MTSFHPLSRRAFLSTSGVAFGSVALNALLARDLRAAPPAEKYRGLTGVPHHTPKAKRVIFLYMSGGPSHLETFDYKPQLDKLNGEPMPESFTKGQPIAQLVRRVLDDPPSGGTEQAAKFTWDECARRHDDVYRALTPRP